ncbi:MAG: sodium/glutamate symporter [Acidaminococcaceae bacterium]
MLVGLNMYQTAALAIVIYYVGGYLRNRYRIFATYCIPVPVVGGVVFACLNLLFHYFNLVNLQMDETLQQLFMTMFFTSIGYTASLQMMKKGGKQVFIFVALCGLLIIAQDVLGIALAQVFDLNPLLGLAVGSIPMVGGHGTSGSFGPLLESIGVRDATVVAIAAATFGLVMGSMIGGPIAKRLINKNKLATARALTKDGIATADQVEVGEPVPLDTERFMNAFGHLFIAMGVGSIVTKWFVTLGIVFPGYIGAMLVAALIRNLSDYGGWYPVYTRETEVLGSCALNIFLSMALMTLRLWELAALAVPLVVMLLSQTVLMGIFAYYITYNVMGRNYEAAVIAAANCGFGMGATPNAIANMKAITERFGPAPQAFFVVPLVGGLFVDFVNAGIITFFINLFH